MPPRRVVVTTVLATVLASAIAVAVELATDLKTNPWAWLGVGALTALAAVIAVLALQPQPEQTPAVASRPRWWRRRPVFLIGAAVLLIATVVVVVLAVDRTPSDPEPTRLIARPVTLADVESRYFVEAGVIELDLTGLPPAGELATNVHVDVGDVRVVVGAQADLEATCSAGTGTVDCLGRTGRESSASDLGADGAGGLKISLDARTGSGTVEVRRE